MCASEVWASPPQLECRQSDQSWSLCRIGQRLPGEDWFLEIGPQRVDFLHNGSGRMTMRIGEKGIWQSVEPRWTADQSLCWGDICARGQIPLD
ncbi:MAG: hypothetical protein CL862_10260 [Cyanobium sp. NAT70]|nr:hypothetical protein [Cyanobium sp. NAT70]